MTKIDIFSGFLGSGKTTLIKKLVAEAFQGEKVVLIENEFGEINIDSGFLKDSGIEITEMSSGCICCTLVGDFGDSLRRVISQFNPDRVLIEPSGVGKLSDVIRAVQGVAADLDVELSSFVTVADAKKCRLYVKNFGEFYLDQVEHAKAIILSRTQDISQEKLQAAVTLLRQHNPSAKILTTPWDQLTGAQILETMEGDKSLADQLLEELAKEPVHEHHHHHDHEHHDGHDECCEHHDHDHDHHHDHDECCGHHDH
ncbi:MAG: CobW family GTP-binding protein, partial [Anaerovoracaceae bacterium]